MAGARSVTIICFACARMGRSIPSCEHSVVAHAPAALITQRLAMKPIDDSTPTIRFFSRRTLWTLVRVQILQP